MIFTTTSAPQHFDCCQAVGAFACWQPMSILDCDTHASNRVLTEDHDTGPFKICNQTTANRDWVPFYSILPWVQWTEPNGIFAEGVTLKVLPVWDAQPPRRAAQRPAQASRRYPRPASAAPPAWPQGKPRNPRPRDWLSRLMISSTGAARCHSDNSIS